jgi:DNA-binding winged helix-turn-helix (wHTH) protein
MQIRFGSFCLDTDRRLLLHGDEARHLSPKGLELLQLLVASGPRALSKAELHERLWPSVFVSEATLSSLVAEVRSALGESAQSGGFVRTVHRYGYAFNGDAVESGPQARTPANRTKCWIIWEFGQVALPEGEHLLGRAGDVAVWLESPTISRHHARVFVQGEAAAVEDLDSKNGTFLRGERLAARAQLADGDELRLGSVAVTFRMTGGAGSTVTRTSTQAETKDPTTDKR